MRTPTLPVSYITLDNGLRVVHLHTRSAASAMFGICVHTGSRNEAETEFGLAHFVEHTIFKGTVKRSPWHIINRMEAIGGELNAYTTKEETVIYSIFPGGNLDRAAELIADLAENSQFPKRELDKEREVVADEINSYLDSPSEAVYDDFEDLIFAGSSLGHNILGNVEALSTFDSDVCRKYLKSRYVPTNMVAFYSGPLSASRAFNVISKHFSSLSGSKFAHSKEIIPDVKPFNVSRQIDTHQAHTIIGAKLPGLFSNDRHAIALLTNILGGPGMNSLLNVALRERRGLVYSVEATTTLLTDCGLLTIYFGCDPEDTQKCSNIVYNTLNDIANGSLNDRAVERAKKQYLGQLAIAFENRENTTLNVARATLLRGAAIPPSDTINAIKAISSNDLRQVATSLIHSSSLTLSPNCNE
jgi:predicted Zn-dependent peptidase